MKANLNLVAAIAALLVAGPVTKVAAQGAAAGPPVVRFDSANVRHSSTLLRVSKWAMLGTTVGAAAYGFSTNRTADHDYAALEQMCVADRENCLRRTGEAYTDAQMEQRYQDVKSLDRKARYALLGTQVGVVATVALFVYDLRHARPPKDIPYTPRALDLVPRSDGSLQLRLTLPLPVDQRKH
jgi:hypothetical protein